MIDKNKRYEKQRFKEQERRRMHVEIDPDNYKQFLLGVKTLTQTERTVFEYYLAGKKVKEIVELLGVKESTVRFHNRNIYSKLGVNSLKQLLLFASVMKRDKKEAEDE